jgi:hypothetical protein
MVMGSAQFGIQLSEASAKQYGIPLCHGWRILTPQ